MNQLGIRVDRESLAGRQAASRLRLGHLSDGAIGLLESDLNEAHSAHADGFHSRVIAEDRHFEAESLHRLDDQLPFRNLEGKVVDGDIDGLNVRDRGHGLLSQASNEWTVPAGHESTEFRRSRGEHPDAHIRSFHSKPSGNSHAAKVNSTCRQGLEERTG